MKKSKLMLKLIIAGLLLLLTISSVVFAQPTISVSAGCSPTRVELVWPELPGATDYTGYRCAGAGCTPSTLLWGNNLQPDERVIEGGVIRYTDLLAQSGTLYRYQVYSTPGNKPSNIAEITVPACCSADMGKSCGSCGGTVKCDGSCSVSTPSDFNKDCNCGVCGCGGKIKCDGTCSGANPKPSNYGQECGSCGGTVKCDSSCSIPTPNNFGKECNCAPCGCGGTIICDGSCSGSTPACPTPEQLIYRANTRDIVMIGDVPTIGGIKYPITCNPFDGTYCRNPTISCLSGDKRISCQDTGVGRNHGCDTVGDDSCHAWEAKGNRGVEGCKIACEKKEGCYDKNGNFANPGTLTRESFGIYYPKGGPAQTDPDQSSGACGCLLVKDWNDVGKCCGDDKPQDCAKTTSGLLCNIDETFSSAKWNKASEVKGDIKYVGCSGAEYLSDGTSWTKCDGVFLKQSVEGNEYVCVGKGKETFVECCGDGDCNSDSTDGKRLTTGQSISPGDFKSGFTVVSDTTTEFAPSQPSVPTLVHESWPQISGAAWIWSSSLVDSEDKFGPYTFKKMFTLPNDADAITGSIQITADNAYKVYLNGVFIGSDGTVSSPPIDHDQVPDHAERVKSIETYTVKPKNGENILEIKAVNYRGCPDPKLPDEGCAVNPNVNPAGLIYKIDITYKK